MNYAFYNPFSTITNTVPGFYPTLIKIDVIWRHVVQIPVSGFTYLSVAA